MQPKRLILSRKGFDSSSGGCPSPIFPDGTMYSLPIPDEPSHVAYGDLCHGSLSIGQLVADLTRAQVGSEQRAHLDPDINRETYPRTEGWRPLFGTSRSAQGHLRKQGVGHGDAFLFFGLYQQVVNTDGRWRFKRDAPRQHVLWGWLQVGDVHAVDRTAHRKLPWAAYHPHLSERYEHPGNTLYAASDRLDVGDGPIALGAGVFPRFDKQLVLTDPNGSGVTHWRLPHWFYPDGGKPPLSYHGNRERWKHDDGYACLQSVSRGQEFVLDIEHYPEALGWMCGLVRDFGES